jgi:hypothetical protein
MSTDTTAAAAPIALASMIALSVNAGAPLMLFMLTVVVITLRVDVVMCELPVLVLISHDRRRVPATTGVNRCRYTRRWKRPLRVQKREQEEAMEKPDEKAVHSSRN